MGFLSRFRRSAKTLDDIGSIVSDEDLPVASENSNATHEMESVPFPEHEVESEWESTESIDSIHLDRDKKSQRLVERKKKSQKPPKKVSIHTRSSKLVPRPSQGLSIDIDHLVEKKSRREKYLPRRPLRI